MLAPLGRLLLGGLFLAAGIGKVTAFAGTSAYIASKGLPVPDVLAALTIALEIAGGLAVIIGYQARLAALALAAFTVAAAILFHDFWAVPKAMVQVQQAMFMKNLAIAGGLLLITAFGPGAWSIKR